MQFPKWTIALCLVPTAAIAGLTSTERKISIRQGHGVNHGRHYPRRFR
jgi:hypothetical protein